MDRLTTHIRQHYADRELSQEKIQTILSRGENLSERFPSRYLTILVTAAVLILGFLFTDHHLEKNRLKDRVLAEIAMNHNQQLQVEVTGNRYQNLQIQLNRLDFALLPSDPTVRETYTLLGGRYCSIQGGLAAQLKVKHKRTGDVLTLYVTRLTKPLKAIASQTATHDNVTIRLWTDNDRLFGLAGIN